MSRDEAILKDLKALGLSVLGSRVYLMLLQRTDPATGYELAKELGVARANVYDALRGLAQAGFVRSITVPDGGARYQAVPFQEVGEAQIRDIAERVARLQQVLPALARPPRLTQEIGWSNFQRRVDGALRSAQISIHIGTSVLPARAIQTTLQAAPPVPIRFGCWDECPGSGCGVCQPPIKNLSRWTNEPACLVVVDDRLAIGSWGSPDEPAVLFSDYPAIVKGWRALLDAPHRP
jgi:predicted transcriptional regulator